MSTVSQEDKMSRGQGNQVLDKLEDAGLDKKLAQLIVGAKDNRLAEKLVEFVEAYASALRLMTYYKEPDMEMNSSGNWIVFSKKCVPLNFEDKELGEFYNREKPRRHNLHIKF
jgi:hypothetical protein